MRNIHFRSFSPIGVEAENGEYANETSSSRRKTGGSSSDDCFEQQYYVVATHEVTRWRRLPWHRGNQPTAPFFYLSSVSLRMFKDSANAALVNLLERDGSAG